VFRRAFLLSAIAGLSAITQRARAYYQIEQLKSPQFLVVNAFLQTYDDEIRAKLPSAEYVRSELIDYLVSEFTKADIHIPVGDSKIYVEPREGVHPSNIVQVAIRIDIARVSDSSVIAAMGAAGISFERNGAVHLSSLPFSFFEAQVTAADLKQKCIAAAEDQINRTVIPQLVAERPH
jgi:hypothetical protein